ncbi:unnamed protein product [Cuscuta campestris]|uniref:Uncharacterized protein n=1 Tax=Cuscuta campestris TaxID=132261 RepID=A0A484MUH6_9ASTE|nr:unnamed protein product [Cuscuta campestris]
MEGFQKTVRDAISQDPKATLSSISSFFQNSSLNSSSTSGSAKISSTDHSQLLLSRPPRQMVSLWTCSKLCAVFFVAGVFVGYTLKRRVRLWASKLLKRLKDY